MNKEEKTMDYKEKYENALKRAKAIIEIAANRDEAIGFANTIFPELKESENEKTRKSLIDFVEQYGDNYYGQIAKASAIAWLEKQCGKLQWKPTDEQMQALELVVQYHTFADQDKREKIVALFNDLKKL